MNYTKICFVVMPFGTKEVDEQKIDFDKIYDEIFFPALSSITLPEGGNLVPHRTDRDYFSGNISHEMFQYLEYSRVTFADITSLNPNVMYELGVRHALRPSGTVLFKQPDSPIPFDISQTKAFPYLFEPEEHAAESRELLRKVVCETLAQNKLDSPVQLGLKAQQNLPPEADFFLQEAQHAIRNRDLSSAVESYKQLQQLAPSNAKILYELGILYRNLGRFEECLPCFNQALLLETNFPGAWREKGIAENKLFHDDKLVETGRRALEQAIKLDPTDSDAHSCLGGILKREKKFDGALQCYEKAAELSNGDSYPLLNAIKLRVQLNEHFELTAKDRFLLKKARNILENQINCVPPYNAPWSFFDLTEIHLFLGNPNKSMEILELGMEHAASWHAETFCNTLNSMSFVHAQVQGMPQVLEQAQKMSGFLS